MREKKQLTPVQITLFLLAIIAITRAMGLVRTILLTRFLGAGFETAAFEVAQNLTATLYDSSIGALLATMFLPAYLARRHANSQQKANDFAFTIAAALSFGVFFLFSPFLLFPRQMLLLLAKNLSEQAIASAATALRLLSLGRIFLALSSLFTILWQADRKPLVPATIYALASFIGIPLVFLFRTKLSAVFLAKLFLGIDIVVFLLLFVLLWHKHRPRSLQRISPLEPRKTAKKAIDVLLFSAYLPLATCFCSLFLSAIGQDLAVAAGGYAIKPILLVAALLFSAFHAVYYPKLSQDTAQIRENIKKSMAFFLTLSLLCTAFFFVFANPIVSLFWNHSEISSNFFVMSVRLIRLFSLSLPFLTLAAIDNDTAYLCHKTRSVAAVSLFSLILDVSLVLFLKDRLGVYAVPLAFLAGAVLRAVLLHRILFSHLSRQNNKIKLLLVLTDRNVGGAGRQILNYLKHCNTDRFSIAVVLPSGAALSQEIENLGFVTLTCGKESSFSFSSLFSYYRLIRRHKPTILHANASLSARLAAFFAAVPIRIYTRHCVYPVPSLFQKQLPRLAVRFATRLLSTSVIAVANEAANNLYGMGVSPKQVFVIVNGVDPIAQSDTQREDVRKRYHIPPHQTLAVICGRLERDKGISTLIEAASILAKTSHPIAIIIVGTGSEETTLRDMVQTLDLSDKVFFSGFVKDVSPYLNAADVYVNCSIGTEATSLAIAEAMSLSLPIVASNYGGNPDMVKDGLNGILVPPKNPRILAEALSVMTDEALRRRFGKHSYEIYASQFSAVTMARAHEAFYQNLLTKKGNSLT